MKTSTLFSSIRTLTVSTAAASGLCLTLTGTAMADHHEEHPADKHTAAPADEHKGDHKAATDKEKGADTHAGDESCGAGSCSGKKK